MSESNSSSSHHEVEYQGNDGENQQQVNQSAGYVEYGETTEPCDQQNDE